MAEELTCCGMTFKDKQELEQHMQQVHGSPKQ